MRAVKGEFEGHTPWFTRSSTKSSYPLSPGQRWAIVVGVPAWSGHGRQTGLSGACGIPSPPVPPHPETRVTSLLGTIHFGCPEHSAAPGPHGRASLASARQEAVSGSREQGARSSQRVWGARGLGWRERLPASGQGSLRGSQLCSSPPHPCRTPCHRAVTVLTHQSPGPKLTWTTILQGQ